MTVLNLHPSVKPVAAPLDSENSFDAALLERGISKLRRTQMSTLQVNVGKRCNQACRHCHVDAGPNRREEMNLATAERVLTLLRTNPEIQTLDLTGGAPEMNPHFRFLAEGARKLGRHVIDRCNLTVLFEAGQEDTASFLAKHRIQIVASLACYSKENVELQRGRAVFDKSIAALRILNDLGYGKPDSGLVINLVYNPLGPSLPPRQAKLEADYHAHLADEFGVFFNGLLTITNMPIHRFADSLRKQNKLEDYQQLLLENFNPDTLPELMCRSTLSVSYDGRLFDCDFNQMLELGSGEGPRTIWEFERVEEFEQQPIATDTHCFGCTAGAGSSCGGALT